MAGFEYVDKECACTSCEKQYDVVVHRPYTVGEFIDSVLKDDNDFGSFRFVIKDKPYDIVETESYKYQNGKLRRSIPSEISKRKIASISALYDVFVGMTHFICLE